MIINRLLLARSSLIFNFELRQSEKLLFTIQSSSDKRLYQTHKVFGQYPVTSIGICVDKQFFAKNIPSRAMNTVDQSLIVNYDDIIEAQGNDGILIVDVREEDEIQETGKLPGSIHIPMNDVIKAFNLSEDDFKKMYHRKKPTHADKIFLSCRSGKRSAMVQAELQQLGYFNSYNYGGGWLDWESKQHS